MRFVFVVLGALVVAGCGTKYQEMGFSGGVEAQQVMADTYRIVARGNGYTSNTKIQDYALLKAAETTIAAGATHFAIISASDASRTHHGNTGGSATTTFSGGQAYTSFSPGTNYTIVKPGQDAYIRVLKLKPGQSADGAFPASEIIQFVGARVERS